MKFPLLLLFSALAAPGQSPAPVVSPEVHPDRTITFRLRDPHAREVLLALDGAPPSPMQPGGDGVWAVTTAPLEPDFYGYSFRADGVDLADPNNPLIKANLINLSNLVHVPGAAALSWELNDVPHGEVHRHFYRSAIVGDQRDYYVYTPPGYDPTGAKRYPTLYLLHGYTDDASGWTAVGRANVILDNLIARGSAVPMVVVMPLGYGAPEIVARATARLNSDPAVRARNYARFQDALLQEVMPRVEREYRLWSDRNFRAVAGLSMGGAEALLAGLNHPDRFAWIGAFSAGLTLDDFPAMYAGVGRSTGAQLRLLWIACGTEDRLLAPNRKFREWLTARSVPHTDIETPGGHGWPVWRRNLTMFVPLLFR